MKLETRFRHHTRNRDTGRLLFTLVCASLFLAGVMALTSCGGTFTLRPDGSLSYTTKEILKAPIVEAAK
jgi:hypothetical protein